MAGSFATAFCLQTSKSIGYGTYFLAVFQFRIRRIRIFRASRSRSISIFTDLDPSINKQKRKKKLHFYFILSLHFDFLSSKTDVNVSKSDKQKNLLFVGILSATDEKSRNLVRQSVIQIRGYGSVPKCHESTTLLF